MQIIKEKAINLILLGLAVQYFPLITVRVFVKNLNDLPFTLSLLIVVSLFILILVGYIFFIKGCRLYTQSKGYSSNWGWLGLLSVLGLSVLLLIPDSKNIVYTQPFANESLSKNYFNAINIPELFLSVFIALQVLFYLLVLFFCLLNNLSFSSIVASSIYYTLNSIFCFIGLTIILFFNLRKAGFKISNFIHKNNINFKLILIVLIMRFAFYKGFESLTLYNLSFIFPGYVENYVNNQNFTNVLDIILWSLLITLLVPVIDELLFQGIVMQKWSSKWGVKLGILISSLLFVIVHSRFNIVPVLVGSILSSILYFKTGNLLTPIICRFFYNTIFAVLGCVDYFSKSITERKAFISVSSYQASIQPLLGQKVLLIAITAPLIGYFIYKYFPKNDAILPYADSES